QALARLGAARRRRGAREAAREPLLQALELADEGGAEPLAAQIRAELNRMGVRPRRTARRGLGALTVSERGVVELAACGRTNRQIATQLHVTTSTVEFHLTRAYRKLDVHSRRELEPLLAGEHERREAANTPAR
ncbi:MAG: helix-turn-helix transcriptional regulator, partial [Chloroflexota bacterium]|nr:helix-turn-helix transcriptional regulator [Chloroflexota bacterium]